MLSGKVLLIALVLLPGCSTPEGTPHRVIGNGAYVSIFNAQNEKDATPLADRTGSGGMALIALKGNNPR